MYRNPNESEQEQNVRAVNSHCRFTELLDTDDELYHMRKTLTDSFLSHVSLLYRSLVEDKDFRLSAKEINLKRVFFIFIIILAAMS